MLELLMGLELTKLKVTYKPDLRMTSLPLSGLRLYLGSHLQVLPRFGEWWRHMFRMIREFLSELL
jgi:hypothetical protein